MAIQFNCAHASCGRAISAPDAAAGKRIRCPHCGKVQKVPAGAGAAAGGAEDQGGQGLVRTCPVCGTAYQAGETCPRCHRERKTYAHDAPDVGRIVKIALALAVLGGIALGVWLVLRLAGQTGGRYMNAVFDSRHAAERVIGKVDLAHVGQAVKMYSAGHDRYPDSLDQLVSDGTMPAQLLQPGLVYLAGQDERMPSDNILVYDETADRDGRITVLRLSGQVESLQPEVFQEALKRTRGAIERK